MESPTASATACEKNYANNNPKEDSNNKMGNLNMYVKYTAKAKENTLTIYAAQSTQFQINQVDEPIYRKIKLEEEYATAPDTIPSSTMNKSKYQADINLTGFRRDAAATRLLVCQP